MSYQGSVTVFIHAVNLSVPEETISSKPDKILVRKGSNGASVLSQKDAVPWGPIFSQGRAQGCPAGLEL